METSSVAAVCRALKVREEVAPGVVVPFIGLDDLVAMKLEAGRPQDLVDAEKLRRVAGRSEDEIDI